MKAPYSFDANDWLKNHVEIVVKITGIKSAKIKYFIAGKLISFASFLLGCHTTIKVCWRHKNELKDYQ